MYHHRLWYFHPNMLFLKSTMQIADNHRNESLKEGYLQHLRHLPHYRKCCDASLFSFFKAIFGTGKRCIVCLESIAIPVAATRWTTDTGLRAPAVSRSRGLLTGQRSWYPSPNPTTIRSPRHRPAVQRFGRNVAERAAAEYAGFLAVSYMIIVLPNGTFLLSCLTSKLINFIPPPP